MIPRDLDAAIAARYLNRRQQWFLQRRVAADPELFHNEVYVREAEPSPEFEAIEQREAEAEPEVEYNDIYTRDAEPEFDFDDIIYARDAEPDFDDYIEQIYAREFAPSRYLMMAS